MVPIQDAELLSGCKTNKIVWGRSLRIPPSFGTLARLKRLQSNPSILFGIILIGRLYFTRRTEPKIGILSRRAMCSMRPLTLDARCLLLLDLTMDDMRYAAAVEPMRAQPDHRNCALPDPILLTRRRRCSRS